MTTIGPVPADEPPPWGSPDNQPAHPPSDGGPALVALRCPMCSGTSFDEEEGRMQTRWGMGAHIFTIQVCRRCSHTLFFRQGAGMGF